MANIVNIGGHGYLVAKASDAAAVVKALAGAVALEYTYIGDHHKVWFPTKYEHVGEVSMQTVPDSRILNADPKDVPIDLDDRAAAATPTTRATQAARRRVNGRQQLLIENGGAA